MGKNKKKHPVQSLYLGRGFSGAHIPTTPRTPPTGDDTGQSQAHVSPENKDTQSKTSPHSHCNASNNPDDDKLLDLSQAAYPNHDPVLKVILDHHTSMKPGYVIYDAILDSKTAFDDFINITLEDAEALFSGLDSVQSKAQTILAVQKWMIHLGTIHPHLMDFEVDDWLQLTGFNERSCMLFVQPVKLCWLMVTVLAKPMNLEINPAMYLPGTRDINVIGMGCKLSFLDGITLDGITIWGLGDVSDFLMPSCW